MEEFKKHLQAAIDTAPDMQTKGDLMRMFYAVTGERPKV